MSDTLSELAELAETSESVGTIRMTLSSSCIAAIEYNAEMQELTIEFQQRGSHTYSGVPPDEVLGLIKSGSPGAYFNANIRNNY